MEFWLELTEKRTIFRKMAKKITKMANGHPLFSLSPLFFCKNRLFLFCALCSPMSGTWRLPKCVPTQSQPYPAHFGPKSDFSNFRRWPFGGQCVTTIFGPIFGPITISIFVSELQPVMLVMFFFLKNLYPAPLSASVCR